MKEINIHNFNFSHVLVDPPRAGLDKEVIKLINKFENIIYISCITVSKYYDDTVYLLYSFIII